MKSWSEGHFFCLFVFTSAIFVYWFNNVKPNWDKEAEKKQEVSSGANISYQRYKCIQEILKQEINKYTYIYIYWSNGLYLNSFLEISSSVINSIHPSPFSFYFSQTKFCSSLCFFSIFVCQVIFKVTLIRSERITEKLSKMPFSIFIRTLSGQSPLVFLFFLPCWITATFHKLL